MEITEQDRAKIAKANLLLEKRMEFADAWAVDKAASARMLDVNGWFEVKGNPLSKAGVYSYGGNQLPGAPDPTKVYRVYRPADELADPECLASFRLLPWIDNHVMLGAEDDGLTPAERKGVQGVIGEKVYFDSAEGTLFGNLKVFSQSLANLIEAGKRELSCGYRCKYEWTPGVFEGQQYDAVQRSIRGNHLALVESGRMGPGVAVLDGSALDHFTFTIDAKDSAMGEEANTEIVAPDDSKTEEVKAMSLEDAVAAIAALMPAIEMIQKAAAATQAAVEEPEAVGTDAKDDKPEAKTETKKPEPKPAKVEVKVEAKPVAVMDEATYFKSMTKALNAREALYMRLSPIVGAFDHAEMTEAEVALYGIKKLGLKAKPGQEQSMLDGYLQAATVQSRKVVAMDSAPEDNWLTRQLKKKES